MSGHQLLKGNHRLKPVPRELVAQTLVCALLLCALPCSAADLDEIVSRGAAALKADWAAHEDYAFIEKDETLKNGRWTAKTSQVVFIDGSDYYTPVPADPAVLSAEIARRNSERPAERRARIEKYRKASQANETLIRDFPDAFTFALTTEETVDGRRAYVLAATPKKRTGSLSLAAKLLSGMQGTVWVDQETFQPIRVECDVVRSVPVYGILAKVLPGTHVEFAMTPVTDSVWLLGELSMNLRISKFFFFRSAQVTRSTYTDYRLNSEMVAFTSTRQRITLNSADSHRLGGHGWR